MSSFPEAALRTGQPPAQPLRSLQVDWESVREAEEFLSWKAPLWIVSLYLAAWASYTLLDSIRDAGL